MQTRRLPRCVASSRLPRKKQPEAWLPHAGFHALIGRIFSAALQCDFDTGGIVSSRRHAACRDKPLLAQFSGRYFEREDETIRFPRKRLGSIWSGKETRDARHESAECRGPTGRQEGSTIHADSQRFHSPAERRKKMSGTHHPARNTDRRVASDQRRVNDRQR